MHDAALLAGGAALGAKITPNPEVSGMSSERLHELIAGSVYGISFRRLHKGYGEQWLTFARRGQFPINLAGERLMFTGSIADHHHRVNAYKTQDVKEYVGRGAAELVTYNHGVARGDLMGVHEPLSLINYTTIRDSADGSSYPYPEIPDEKNSRDVTLNYGILLPDSEARELFAAMQDSPR